MISLRGKLAKMLEGYEGTGFELGYWDGTSARFGKGAPVAKVHFRTRTSFYRSLFETSLGFGEGYVNQTIRIEGDLEEALLALSGPYLALSEKELMRPWMQKMIARSLPREKADIEHHYGLGNEFYELYLDKKLQYSCGYFRTEDTSLDQAQDDKIEHTARKLYLQPGQKLLDVGCGWGHLMFHAAERYGVECHGITLCDNQASYIREQAKRRNLPVHVRVQSYLELPDTPKWDRIVSVGMMCHIGESRVDQFYDKIKSLSAPGAVVLLHCISKMVESTGSDPFVEKHVFPGYWFNSLEGMTSRAARRGYNVLDVENLRRHYALTAHHWRKNFLTNYDVIQRKLGFDDRFMRTWEFYLASVVAGFKSGHMNLIQMVMSNGVQDAYPWTREFMYPQARAAEKNERRAPNATDAPLYS